MWRTQIKLELVKLYWLQFKGGNKMTEQCGSNMHGHHQEGSCSCGCGCGKNFHVHGDSEGGCNCAEKFLQIADEAWKEVLKESIKAKIIAKKGEHIDKLAEMVAAANGEKWKNKISAKTHCNKFKDELKEYFSEHD